jgi:hypothetical protein
MNVLIDSREGFTAQEEMAYHEAADVRELDLESLVGIACCPFPGGVNGGKQVYHWQCVSSFDSMPYIVIDRRKLGSKSSRRFMVIKPNYNQDIIGLCCSLKEVQELIFKSGVIYK